MKIITPSRSSKNDNKPYKTAPTKPPNAFALGLLNITGISLKNICINGIPIKLRSNVKDCNKITLILRSVIPIQKIGERSNASGRIRYNNKITIIRM